MAVSHFFEFASGGGVSRPVPIAAPRPPPAPSGSTPRLSGSAAVAGCQGGREGHPGGAGTGTEQRHQGPTGGGAGPERTRPLPAGRRHCPASGSRWRPFPRRCGRPGRGTARSHPSYPEVGVHQDVHQGALHCRHPHGATRVRLLGHAEVLVPRPDEAFGEAHTAVAHGAEHRRRGRLACRVHGLEPE